MKTTFVFCFNNLIIINLDTINRELDGVFGFIMALFYNDDYYNDYYTMHDYYNARFQVKKNYEQFISLFSMNIVISCDYKTIWVLLKKGRIVDGGCVRKE